MQSKSNEDRYAQALESNMFIDYCAKDINTIASAILTELEEEDGSNQEELMEVKKYLNTIITVLLTEKEWCDDTLKEIEEYEKSNVKEYTLNSLPN